ncbi:Transcriptional regulator, TetR family [Grimontia indica]|uniref:Transcriptional regulator, TetR family n=2 Tax=Grimontia TaxID=246861 RepID=R1GZF9_9GAMM|nr:MULTISPECIES: TetR/AcrR family transcriptional regulator [Grimontia]EOD81464.1 Transcriptional regulator, TetR family [Grimontia indica]NGN97196.1 TetR/AcrR family transcriptional regulator [Grimontia sedimenti]
MTTHISQRKEQKRQQILSAAVELFSKQGYGISMDAIAVHANVSKQTVYAHFSSKDQLFETCIIEKCISAGLELDLEHESRAAHVVLREFGWLFQNMLLGEEARNTFQNTIRQSGTHPEIARIFLEQGPIRNINRISDYLSLLVKRGELPLCDNTESAAMQLLLMLHGRAVYWALLGFDSEEDAETRRTYVHSCVDLFLRGYGYPTERL